MATKSKLEQAVEERAKSLNDAQRELLLSQFKTYRANNLKIAEIDDKLGMMNVQALANPELEKLRLANRLNLVSEKSHLQEANNSIAANLFDQLKE